MRMQRVDFASLRQLENGLQKCSTAIGDELQQLDDRVASLRSSWTGEAAEAYHVAREKWTTQMAEMNAFLARISAAVGTTEAAYTETEKHFAGQL